MNTKARRGDLRDQRRAPVLAGAVLLGILGVQSCGGGGSGSSDPVVDSSNAAIVASVDPAAGPAFGGSLVTITGEGFMTDVVGPTRVFFGGLEATDVVVVDDTTITAMTPAGTPGLKSKVVVRNSRGDGVLNAGFLFLKLPKTLSDLDGDEIADVVIGAPRESSMGSAAGAVYVFRGSNAPIALTDRGAGAANIKLVGEAAGDNFGHSIASGDLNGDSEDDLVIGADRNDASGVDAGAVYIFYGPLQDGVVSPLTADVVIRGDGTIAGEHFGSALSIGDVDDDGHDDLLVGATGADVTVGTTLLANAGCVYVFLGDSGFASGSASNADLRINGDQESGAVGNEILTADFNGDGIADITVAASLYDPMLPPRKQDAGSVYTFFGGPALASAAVSAADVAILGDVIGDEFGDSITFGDFNLDGVSDLVVGVPLNDTLGTDVGRVFLFWGGASYVSKRSSAADVKIEGQPTNDGFGDDVAVGDVNGDGLDDLVAGAPKASFGASGNGRSYVFFGRSGFGNSVATSADVIFTGEPVASDRFGACSKVVDYNGDGRADVMSSAPGNDGGGLGAGRVYMFKGKQIMGDKAAGVDDTTYTGEGPGNQFGGAMVDGN